MKKRLTLLLVTILALFALVGCTTAQKSAKSTTTTVKKSETIVLATTTSTMDTGLLDELLPAFEEKTGIKVKPIAVGTGEALAMGERGEADVLLVHSRDAEDKFMADGFGTVRKDVMHNDFVVVGPESDPGKTKGSGTAADAFKKVAAAKATFVSRADDSGTDKKEKKIWASAEIKPSGSWYVETGQGMGETIKITDEKQGYTLADRGTYLALKDTIKLSILVEKVQGLLNPYGVIAVSQEKFPQVKYEAALEFVNYLVSDEGQALIGEFGKAKYGQPLFVPDAK